MMWIIKYAKRSNMPEISNARNVKAAVCLSAVLILSGGLAVSAEPALKDFGLKEYIYTSKDLPRVETNTWRLVCRLPYNAQYTAWIRCEADATGKVVSVDSSNPLVRAQQAEQKFTTSQGENTWEMPGWVSGEGAIYTIPAGVKVLKVQYRETGYPTEVAGSFRCNDQDFNVLWQKATRTLYLCIREHYMDCPDRERSEWLGDAVLQMEECFYAYDLASHQMAKRLILSKQINGLPGQNLMAHGEYGDWCYYLYTGDLETLAAVYENTRKYLYQYNIGTNGLPVHRREGWDWYDWGTGYQDKTVLQVAEYYSALSALRKMALATGHQDDLASIDSRLSSVKNNFDGVFWKDDGYRSGKLLDERANAIAVCAGLADSSKWQVITGLIGTNGNCGPYFERWVLEALCVMGKPDLALTRMTNRYRGQIDSNFTTLWEYMERGFPIKRGTDSVQYLTLNHAWNTPNTILSKFIAGVAPDSPGWAAYHVLPQEAFLSSLETRVPTVKGEVALSIRKTASEYSLSMVSPANTMATVGIPRDAFSELRSIKVNGKLIWDGAHTGSVEGVSAAGEDARYVKFSVKPGSWNFVGIGVVKTFTPTPPAAPDVSSGVKLDKKDWTTSASLDNKTFGTGPWKKRELPTDASSANAIDGDYWTGWRTIGQDQVPGQWFVVDMQKRQEFNRIVMDNVWAVYDSPAEYSIYVSDDGKNWDVPVATGKGERWGVTTASFKPVTGRYIKVEQTGKKNQFWSIFEIDVYKP
jgi:alpha-L-rhamnosidase